MIQSGNVLTCPGGVQYGPAMSGYTKLFPALIASTIWREEDHVRIVWITMLAMANRDGEVEASVPGLADLARVDVELAREAIRKLSSPDKDSRTYTEACEGRRIEAIHGGWHIINYDYYRYKASAEEAKSKDAERKRRARARAKASENVQVTSGSVRESLKSPPIAEAEAEAEQRKRGADSPPLAAPPPRVRRGTSLPDDWELADKDWEFALSRGWSRDKVKDAAIHFAAHHRAKGSIMKNWEAAWRTWVMNDAKFAPRQPVEQKRGPAYREESDQEVLAHIRKQPRRRTAQDAPAPLPGVQSQGAPQNASEGLTALVRGIGGGHPR